MVDCRVGFDRAVTHWSPTMLLVTMLAPPSAVPSALMGGRTAQGSGGALAQRLVRGRVGKRVLTKATVSVRRSAVAMGWMLARPRAEGLEL